MSQYDSISNTSTLLSDALYSKMSCFYS